ncbi:hypothetical protein J1605_018528 [Eschrichtius robustus]|uniref:Enoyl reductase (ER) domain-containing protein n=1 Tax=Eschrichtius robustus TaxID=9764 RepID=A0AB34HQN5_ESCRO|nr:hypothetical protein J1605_018528 [Eschrichtius robustus]
MPAVGSSCRGPRGTRGPGRPGEARHPRGWDWPVARSRPLPPAWVGSRVSGGRGGAGGVLLFRPRSDLPLWRHLRGAQASAAAWGRCLPRAWLCRAGQGCGRHYRAAVCAELKQPLTIEEAVSRHLRPHEVRVDVHFCGVNFADILACRDQYQERPQLPFTPGMEFSGTVLETGTDVSTVKEGDGVIGVSGFNGMAEECIIDHKALWQIPERVPLREAAALPVSYGTATLALERRARTQPGETVLVTAAAGATGLAVIEVAANVLQAKLDPLGFRIPGNVDHVASEYGGASVMVLCDGPYVLG